MIATQHKTQKAGEQTGRTDSTTEKKVPNPESQQDPKSSQHSHPAENIINIKLNFKKQKNLHTRASQKPQTVLVLRKYHVAQRSLMV